MISPTRRPFVAARGDVIVFGAGIAAGMVVLTWATTVAMGIAKMNDFYREAWPAYLALGHGHLHDFFRLGPPYVGSLLMRAPFALIPMAWGGSTRAIYFAGAFPCMVAVAVFGTWLGHQPRRGGVVTWATRLGPLAFCAVNPLAIVALLGGHPEEILGAVLCVAAVALAGKGSAGWAGLLVALAVDNKPWAVVAIPVVLVALPAGHRRALVVMGAAMAAVMVPATVLRTGGLSAGGIGTGIGTIFNPPQLLWWFGSGSWIAAHARFVIIAAACICAGLWWPSARRSPRAAHDVLLLVALVMLLRAALDPWNNMYYHVPFVFALLAYEVRVGRMPLMTIIYTFALLLVVPIGGVHMSYDLRAAAYAGVVVPTIIALGWKLYAPVELRRRLTRSAADALRLRSTEDDSAVAVDVSDPADVQAW